MLRFNNIEDIHALQPLVCEINIPTLKIKQEYHVKLIIDALLVNKKRIPWNNTFYKRDNVYIFKEINRSWNSEYVSITMNY